MSEHPVSAVPVDASSAGTTAGEVLRAAGLKDSAVARVNGELRDLALRVVGLGGRRDDLLQRPQPGQGREPVGVVG